MLLCISLLGPQPPPHSFPGPFSSSPWCWTKLLAPVFLIWTPGPLPLVSVLLRHSYTVLALLWAMSLLWIYLSEPLALCPPCSAEPSLALSAWVCCPCLASAWAKLFSFSWRPPVFGPKPGLYLGPQPLVGSGYWDLHQALIVPNPNLQIKL